MENAPRDQNSVPVLLATLNTDGLTPGRVLANPTRHSLKIAWGSGGSDNGPSVAPRDENGVPCLLATSSIDGKTPVVVYMTAGGKLLVDET